MAKKSGLGKGLDALFANVEVSTDDIEAGKKNETSIAGEISAENTIQRIGINSITPNTSQPRKYFDEEKLNELADSIKEHGVIQPVILRKISDDGYEIVAGERRWRAARIAGLKEVPCIVRKFTDEENMLVAIIENMQREDLNPIEEAEGLNQMIVVYGLTQSEVAEHVGKSRPHIANSLRLLKLSPEIRELLVQKKITAGHARALLAIDDKKRQLALAEKICEEGLSVRAVEKFISEGDSIKEPAKSSSKKEKDVEILQVERDLKDMLGTKVNIVTNGKKGKIEIQFFSKEELDGLIDILMNN